MPDLQYRQHKIKEKRKQTPWRQYTKELWSWHPLTSYKRGKIFTRYPDEGRVSITTATDFDDQRDWLTKYGVDYDPNTSFFDQFAKLFSIVPMRPLLTRGENDNISYADLIVSSKNCYLSNAVITDCENVLYSLNVKDQCTTILNSMYVQDGSNDIYMSVLHI